MDNIQELLSKLLLKCYKISTETKHDIFFYYSPHCDTITIYIYIEGWKMDTDSIYLTEIGGDLINVANLKNLLTKLENYENK